MMMPTAMALSCAQRQTDTTYRQAAKNKTKYHKKNRKQIVKICCEKADKLADTLGIAEGVKY